MKTLLSIFFITICLAGHTQTIYRLKYKSPIAGDTTIYDTYFSISSNGTGFARVRSADGKAITAMEITEQYAIDANGAPDTTLLVYEGMNPVVVKGSKKTPFPLHSFWFKINSQKLFDPWGVSVPASPAPAEYNFTSALFINDITKNRDTVLQFFADTSEYYKNMFGPKSRGGSLSAEERKKTKMHLIVLASTKDPHLKNNPLIDARKIISTFSDIANKVLGIRFSVDSIYGDKYSKASVQKAIKNLNPGKNDIVVFYYTGHGFTDRNYPEKEYPFLDLRDPSKTLYRKDLKTEVLNIEDIYDSIVKKGARLNLILSDCCNDTIAAPKVVAPPPPTGKGIVKYSFENVKALFMSKVPLNYLMTAASKDERATVTTTYNSYLTHFFITTLNTYLSTEKGTSHWSMVLADTQNQTKFFAGKVPCPKDSPCPDGKMLRQTPKVLRPKL